MAKANLPLRIKRGDSFNLKFDFTNSSANLTGASVRAQARVSPSNPDIAIDWGTKLIQNSLVDLSLTPAETALLEHGSYGYDAELIFPGGEVYTFLEGQVWVDEDYTQ